MKQPAHTGFARLAAAYKNSKAGFRDIWHREEAFRLEVIGLVLSIPVAVWLATGLGQFALLIGSILILMIVEVLNSAIEAAIDRIGLEHHELSRIAKDLGSLAVLLTTVIPVAIWGALVLARLDLISL